MVCAVLSGEPRGTGAEIRAVGTALARTSVPARFQFAVVEGPATIWSREPHRASAYGAFRRVDTSRAVIAGVADTAPL